MSLKCPLSFQRLKLPCRSTLCTHNQCYDAVSFLQLQEQAPTWTCPICNKTTHMSNLVIDNYVEDILNSTPQSCEQVTIEPNGNWSQGDKTDKSQPTNGVSSQNGDDDDDRDDLIDVSDSRINNLKNEAANTPSILARTPPIASSSRASSTAFGTTPAPGRAGSKRPADTIDLTLSDDDDEPPRPVKRQSYVSPALAATTSTINAANGFGPGPAPNYQRPPSVHPFTIPALPSHPSQNYAPGTRPLPRY